MGTLGVASATSGLLPVPSEAVPGVEAVVEGLAVLYPLDEDGGEDRAQALALALLTLRVAGSGGVARAVVEQARLDEKDLAQSQHLVWADTDLGVAQRREERAQAWGLLHGPPTALAPAGSGRRGP